MAGRLNPKGRQPDWLAVPSKITPTEFAFGHGNDNAEFIAQHCCRGDWAVDGSIVEHYAQSPFDLRDGIIAFMVYYFEDPTDAIVFKMKIS